LLASARSELLVRHLHVKSLNLLLNRDDALVLLFVALFKLPAGVVVVPNELVEFDVAVTVHVAFLEDFIDDLSAVIMVDVLGLQKAQHFVSVDLAVAVLVQRRELLLEFDLGFQVIRRVLVLLGHLLELIHWLLLAAKASVVA
jgi:hypothetical protein